MKSLIAVVSVLSAALSALAESPVWINISDDAYYSGPKLSEKELEGKVVLVDEWGVNCPPCRMLLPLMQKFWAANRNGPFVLIGSHRQGRMPAEVKALVDENRITYPVYDLAGVRNEPDNGMGLPFMYVLNHRGRVVYSGRDHEKAFASVQQAVKAIGALPSLCEGVEPDAFKTMVKSLVLGNAIKSQLKLLEGAVKNGEAKNATAVQTRQAEEAKRLLAAIEASRTGLLKEIDSLRESRPEEALKLAKAYVVTFPKEGAELKRELPAMAEKAKSGSTRQN